MPFIECMEESELKPNKSGPLVSSSFVVKNVIHISKVFQWPLIRGKCIYPSPNSPRLMLLFAVLATVNTVYLILYYLKLSLTHWPRDKKS